MVVCIKTNKFFYISLKIKRKTEKDGMDNSDLSSMEEWIWKEPKLFWLK